MKAMFDFKCVECGAVEDHYVDTELNSSTCFCGGLSIKQLSAPRAKLESCSGDFPGAYHSWTEAREKRARKEQAAYAESQR